MIRLQLLIQEHSYGNRGKMPEGMKYAYDLHDEIKKWQGRLEYPLSNEKNISTFAAKIRSLARATDAAWVEVKDKISKKDIVDVDAVTTAARNQSREIETRAKTAVKIPEGLFMQLDDSLYFLHGCLDDMLQSYRMKWANGSLDDQILSEKHHLFHSQDFERLSRMPEDLEFAFQFHDDIHRWENKQTNWDDARVMFAFFSKIRSLARFTMKAFEERVRAGAYKGAATLRTRVKKTVDAAMTQTKEAEAKLRNTVDTEYRPDDGNRTMDKMFAKMDGLLWDLHGALDAIMRTYEKKQVTEGWSIAGDRMDKMPEELAYAFSLHDHIKDFSDRISFKTTTEESVRPLCANIRSLARAVMKAAEETKTGRIIQQMKLRTETAMNITRDVEKRLTDQNAGIQFGVLDGELSTLHSQLDHIMMDYQDARKKARLEKDPMGDVRKKKNELIDTDEQDPDEVQFQDDPRIDYMLRKGSPIPPYPEDALRIKTSDLEKFREPDEKQDEATDIAGRSTPKSIMGKEYFEFAYETHDGENKLSCKAVCIYNGKNWFSSPTRIDLFRDGQKVKSVMNATSKGAKRAWKDFVAGKEPTGDTRD